jgi:hypothetical protein
MLSLRLPTRRRPQPGVQPRRLGALEERKTNLAHQKAILSCLRIFIEARVEGVSRFQVPPRLREVALE